MPAFEVSGAAMSGSVAGPGGAAGRTARLVALELELCRRAGRMQSSRAALAGLRFVSRAGDGACWLVLAAGIVLAGGVGGLPTVGRLSAVAMLATLVSRALKGWVNRRRPFAADSSIAAGCVPLDPWSFPSGHTLHAVAFHVVLIPDWPVLALILVPWTVAIAVSRVALGLHFPSDVAAGAAIGALLATIVLALS